MFIKQLSLSSTFRNFFILVLCIILLPLFVLLIAHYFPFRNSRSALHPPVSFVESTSLPVKRVSVKSTSDYPRNPNCSHYDCFNIYRCGHLGRTKIQIYVYPLAVYHEEETDNPITGQMSLEFYQIIKTIVNSPYYTPNPEEACILVPSIDTLNQNRFNVKSISNVLHSLPLWNGGENHLIWNFIPGAAPDYNTVVDLALGNAMVAGAGFSTWTYRPGFDVSLPVFSPLAKQLSPCSSDNSHSCTRHWLAVNSQTNLHKDYNRELAALPDLVRLTACGDDFSVMCYEGQSYKYPQVLQRSVFCLVIRGARLGHQVLLESMAAGCIPVIAAQSLVLPFQDIIDWKRAAILMSERDLPSVMARLAAVSVAHRDELRTQSMWLYKTYFSTIEKVTRTTLDIINHRVYPQHAPTYAHWNLPQCAQIRENPLTLQLTASRTPGFTAVILTYDRVSSLFLLINQLSRVPSLSKILVVWNNQNKDPPTPPQWPQVSTPVEVIRTKENKLSNRFYPYDQIESEAVLSIDDDITMLTPDELEFGFEVWREFPDRIVGFPSRTHVWDNVTQAWKYESEWRNDVSMVLTGAAFHHKYWNYMYTKVMPHAVKKWVDDHMNCEDIAMNFLVASVTGKAPIKVTPRKKFKCPKCTNTEMLSADLTHMRERSKCINKFAEIYGGMPLIKAEFRADPVLFKDTFPEKLKRFNDIGTL